MRAIAYLRISTGEQTLDTQRDKVIAHCLAHNLDLDPADIFEDAGLSGKRADNRPGLAKALKAVCAAPGALVVYSLSRVARSVRDMLEIATRLEQAGADLISLTESIDTTTAAGKMVFRLLAVLAEFERDLISERTKARLAYKKAHGHRTGSVPIGMQCVDDGNRSATGRVVALVPEPGEQVVLAKIEVLRIQGFGSRAIVRLLSDAGYVSRKGKPWAETTVRRILQRSAISSQQSASNSLIADSRELTAKGAKRPI